jgi:hypothetical protein
MNPSLRQLALVHTRLVNGGFVKVGEASGAHVYVSAARSGDRVVTIRETTDSVVVAYHADGRYEATWRVAPDDPRPVRSLADVLDTGHWLVAHEGLRSLERWFSEALRGARLACVAAVHANFVDAVRFERHDAGGGVVCEVTYDYREQRVELRLCASDAWPLPTPLPTDAAREGITQVWHHAEHRPVGAEPMHAWLQRLAQSLAEHAPAPLPAERPPA